MAHGLEELERGDVFYFYRPRVDADEPDDVQRFYLVLVTERRARMLLVGAQRLPEPDPSGASDARVWALVREVGDDLGPIEEVLRGGTYETRTRGTRHLPPAAPVAEGRYAIVTGDDTAWLVHALRRPSDGEVARRFALRRRAAYVVAVRNPEIEVEGFPDEDPGYPRSLAGGFEGRRWLPLDDLRFLDHPGAQLALMSAGEDLDAGDLGVSSHETEGFGSHFGVDLPVGALENGSFPDLDDFHARHHEPLDSESPFGSGEVRREGGRRSMRASASASAIARLLGGLDMPADRQAVLRHARDHRSRLEDPQPALDRLERLPDRSYADMATLQEALAEAVDASTVCPVCDKAFDTPSALERHRRTSHRESAVSAADLERALGGVSFPATPHALRDHARDQNAEGKVVEALGALPRREYRDAAEVAAAFQESITGRDRSMAEPPSRRAAAGTSAAGLARVLAGVDLPAEREALRDHAASNHADDEMLERIEAMPARTYHDMAEVERGFAEAVAGPSGR